MNPELWSRLLRLGKIAGVVGAIFGAIASGAIAWPHIEPWLAAHRGYVREVSAAVSTELKEAQDKGYSALRDLQVETANGKLDQTEDNIAKWNVELNKAADDQAKQLIQGQIRKLDATRDGLKEQIKTLNKVRSQ